jgi:hypothetical protein
VLLLLTKLLLPSPCTTSHTLQVATVLLARLLSWLHLSQVVCPGSPDCLRFVLVLGERQAGKASLFTRLVAASAEYAGQLGGASAAAAAAAQAEAEGATASREDGTTGMGAEVGLLAAGVAADVCVASVWRRCCARHVDM